MSGAPRILGAVLIGGRSSRFGSDKAEALFGEATLCEHARAIIAPFAERVVLAGGADLPDLPAPGLGPLGGIAAALDHAATNGFDAVLTIGCDMPRLPDGLLDALVRRGPAYCADAPVLGFWPAALGAHLMAHIEGAPDRSVTRWARAVGGIPVHAGASIVNVNTPADLLLL